MHPAWAFAGLLVLTASLAGCAELEDFEVSAPAWESGYTWTYTVDTEFVAGGAFDEAPATYTTQLEVLRHTDMADGAPIYLVEQREGDGAWNSLLGVSSVDLSAHWVEDDVIYDCDGPPACVDAIDLDDGGWGEFPSLRFPLEDGKSWRDTLDDFVTLDATVMGSRQVTTDAGVFDAVEVVFDGKISDVDGDEVFDIQLDWRVYYSEAARAVVASKLHAAGSITETSGGIQQVYEVEVRVDHDLTSYSLTPRAEMTAEGMWDHFDGDSFVNRHLRIVPPSLPSPSAGDASVEFQAQTYNLRSSDRLEWTVEDAGGAVLDTGDGDYFFAEVPYGGIYAVTLEAVRNGTVLLEDSWPFALSLHDSTTIDCGTAIAGTGDVCPEVDVEIGPGAYNLRVDARGSGFYGGGYVELVAPDGTTHGSSVTPEQEGTWTIRYVMEEGIDYSVDLDWDVLYEASSLYP